MPRLIDTKIYLTAEELAAIDQARGKGPAEEPTLPGGPFSRNSIIRDAIRFYLAHVAVQRSGRGVRG